ncbi:reverse transcriptase domain-containing protein [Tanacetum coccineum]
MSENMWKLYTDEASSSDSSGTSLMLVSPKGKEYTIDLRLQCSGQPSKGSFQSQTARNKAILRKDERSLKSFDTYSMEHIRRNQNKKADTLSKLASMTFEHLTKEVLVEVLANRSINNKQVSKIAAETEGK